MKKGNFINYLQIVICGVLMFFMTSCTNEAKERKGYWLSENYKSGEVYYTLNVQDSFLIINANNSNQCDIDTIKVLPDGKSIISSSFGEGFYIDVLWLKDTIAIVREWDSPTDTLIFIRADQSFIP